MLSVQRNEHIFCYTTYTEDSCIYFNSIIKFKENLFSLVYFETYFS